MRQAHHAIDDLASSSSLLGFAGSVAAGLAVWAIILAIVM